MGRLVVEVAWSNFSDYLARPLDLALHREATVLALQAHSQNVAPSARAAWALQQPVSEAFSAALRERLAWSADGQTLTVRSWETDQRTLASGSGSAAPVDQARARIQLAMQPVKP
jgi:hypothetical protein